MSKFNEKKVSSSIPTEVNFMGESAYMMSEKEQLTSMVMTTFLADKYYISENEVISQISELALKCGWEFTAKLALYARNRGNMRSVSHLLASMVCGTPASWLRSFYKNIVVRPDDISEILCCYAARNGIDIANESFHRIPNSMKRGFGDVLSNLAPYQIDKYKMNGRKLSLIDIVNIIHPRPTQKNAEAYRRLMHGESLDGTYDAKILEKEMSAAGQGENLTDEEIKGNKHDAIKAVLEKGMPIMNLLRNIRNIILYAPDMIDEAFSQLTNETKIVNGRILPFRFTSAYDVVANMYSNETRDSARDDARIVFEGDDNFNIVKNKVLNALETAMDIASKNVPELDGNCAILIDHSGSVRGDWGGTSSISKWSSVRTAHIGNLFGSIMAFRQKNVYIGMFGDELISPAIDRSKGILEFNRLSYTEGGDCGGSTENGLYAFLRSAINENKHIDNLIIFSDMEIGNGGEGGWDGTSRTDESFQSLFKKFRKINPNCLTVCVNINGQSGTTVFNPNLKVLNVSGWSNSIFDTISMYKDGKLKSMVEEIESIQL